MGAPQRAQDVARPQDRDDPLSSINFHIKSEHLLRGSALRQRCPRRCPSHASRHHSEERERIFCYTRWQNTPVWALSSYTLPTHTQAQQTNLVNQPISSQRLSKPISSRQRHCSFLISSTIMLMCLLSAQRIQESHCNPTPNGFLDSGHEISCKIGQLINISDYIPLIDDESLNRCYNCTCPNGSVKCSRVEDSADCMLPPTSGLKTGASERQTSNKYKPSAGSRFNPSGSSGAHHYHTHHHAGSHQIVPTKPTANRNGKAKAIGGAIPTQRKPPPKPTLPPTPIAQPIGGHASTSKVRTKSYNLPPASAHQTRAAPFRYQQQESDQEARDQEKEGDDERTARGGGLHEMFQPPLLPLGDSRHHKIAADAMGLPLDKYLQMLERKSRIASDMTSTTPNVPETTATTTTTTTTISPSTLLMLESTSTPEADEGSIRELEEQTEISEDSASSTDDTQETDTDEKWPSTTTFNETTLATVQQETTTTTEMPQLIELTTQRPSWDDTNKLDVSLESNRVDSSKSSDELTAQVTSRSNEGNPSIDQTGANEIMEQVSHDGMLYIAIGIEAFILVSIFAMMILFYIFREKSTDDEDQDAARRQRARDIDVEYARAIRSNSICHDNMHVSSRSPSIEKAAI